MKKKMNLLRPGSGLKRKFEQPDGIPAGHSLLLILWQVNPLPPVLCHFYLVVRII